MFILVASIYSEPILRSDPSMEMVMLTSFLQAPPPQSGSLSQRLLALAQTLQFGYVPFADLFGTPHPILSSSWLCSKSNPQETLLILQRRWFAGHVTLLLCSIRYGLSYITFNYYSRWARYSYRTAFVAAAATYGIVVYKAYRARARAGNRQQGGALALAGDENVQYLGLYNYSLGKQSSTLTDTLFSIGMALVWLFGKQIPLALLPFMVYSVFHVATYTRTNILPTISPPQQPAASASPGGRPATKASPWADTIGQFVKEYYDSSMTLVASLEIFLWFRVLASALLFQKGSWILLVIYSIFVRARYQQSSFVQGAVGQMTARGDALVANQGTPPVAKQSWETFKGVGRQVHDATDLNRYVGGQPMKKA